MYREIVTEIIRIKIVIRNSFIKISKEKSNKSNEYFKIINIRKLIFIICQ